MKHVSLLVFCSLLAASLAAGGESPVKRLLAESAVVEAAAADEIIAAGEKYLPEIEAAYAALSEKESKFRERYRDVVARIRTEDLKKWALVEAPGLKDKFQWDGLVRYLTWVGRLPTPEDARRSFCMLCRNVDDWDEAEATGLLKACLTDGSVKVRRAAVGALDREEWIKEARELLVGVLRDEAEAVRAEAGSALLARGDQRGLSAVLAGAISEEKEVRGMCEGVVMTLIVTQEGGGQEPRFTHTEKEIDVLMELMAIEAWNPRGTVIRLLGMIEAKKAGPALLEQLAREEQPKNRRRLCISLAQLGHRPAAAEILNILGKKLLATKKNYNWAAAACWAQIGDPEMVPVVIALLDDEKLGGYAAAALTWAFSAPEGKGDEVPAGAPGFSLVPAGDKLERKVAAEVPGGAELKKLWEAFWAANKDKYAWSEEKHSLRPPSE